MAYLTVYDTYSHGFGRHGVRGVLVEVVRLFPRPFRRLVVHDAFLDVIAPLASYEIICRLSPQLL